MQLLCDTLWKYAQNRCKQECLRDKEYQENCSYSEKHIQWLRTHLSPEAYTHLQDALAMGEIANSIQGEVLFRVALKMGVRLGAAALEE